MGEEEAPLTIHAAVLKGLSDPLSAMINNGTMKESTSGVAVLKDVEVEIFTAFCEYAYSANFSSTRAKYVNKKLRKEMTGDKSHTSSINAQTQVDESADESDDSAESDGHNDPDKVEVYSRWELDMVLDFVDFRCRTFKRSSRWATRARRTEFVFTVRVYVFATRYLVEPLRQYCLDHLHDKLCDFDLTVENSHRILDLLEYTYLHTSNQEPSGRSLMRELVCHYVACKFDILSQNEDFDRLLRSDADIGADIFMAMAKWRKKRNCKGQCYEC